jgi:hypothetical protein
MKERCTMEREREREREREIIRFDSVGHQSSTACTQRKAYKGIPMKRKTLCKNHKS